MKFIILFRYYQRVTISVRLLLCLFLLHCQMLDLLAMPERATPRPSLFHHYALKGASEGCIASHHPCTRYSCRLNSTISAFGCHCMYEYARHARARARELTSPCYRAAVFAFMPIVSKVESSAGIWKNEVAASSQQTFRRAVWKTEREVKS